MHNIKIILNPNAGKTKGILPKIVDVLKEKNIAFEVLPTNFPGEAKFLAKKASEDKTLDLLLVIGGDGTINEAINGLINPHTKSTDAGDSPNSKLSTNSANGYNSADSRFGVGVNPNPPLGIIPAGSLNCAAREIGLSFNPKTALNQILEGNVKTIHVGKISFLENSTDFVFQNEKERYFLLMAGIGLDAKAVVDFNPKLKKTIGPLAYAWSGFSQIFQNHPKINVVTNNKSIEGYSCIISKWKTYAWFNFAPEAGVEKDFFQMFVYKKNDPLSLLRYSIGGMVGWHRKFTDVESLFAKAVKITSDGTAYVQADGEAVGKLPVEISIVPNAFKIMLPNPTNL